MCPHSLGEQLSSGPFPIKMEVSDFFFSFFFFFFCSCDFPRVLEAEVCVSGTSLGLLGISGKEAPL